VPPVFFVFWTGDCQNCLAVLSANQAVRLVGLKVVSSERGGPESVPTGGVRRTNASDRRAIGGRIKSARQNVGITQRELAKKLGVSAGAVAHWETGSVPATERLTTLTALLDVSLDWLLGKSEQVSTFDAVGEEMAKDLRLLAEARQLGVDLYSVVAEARQQRWIEENRDALADANAFLVRHGLWSDGKRQF
jgi:transcriptional regulator with XRE-family HTH domain